MTVDSFEEDGQDDATNDSEPERYSAVYDGLAGFGPGGAGRSWAARSGHPPLYCPDPKIMPNMRGLYYCPCCSAKVRHIGLPPAGEWARDTVIPRVDSAWEIAVQSAVTLCTWTARAIAWMARAAWNLITRHRQENTAHATMVSDNKTERPEPQSPRQSTPENGRETPDAPPPSPQSLGEIDCTTSDGIHVITTKNGQEQCLVCGIIPAGKEGVMAEKRDPLGIVYDSSWTDGDGDTHYTRNQAQGTAGGPARWSSSHDCNPICGCHLSSKCTGCQVCMICDGCYCNED